MGIFDASQRPNVERMRAQRDIEGLKEALEYSKDSKVRKEAALALGGLGDAEVVESILQALQDTEKEVRKAAAQALGKIGSTAAVESLIRATKDANAGVRGAAARALGDIGDARAAEALTLTALIDKDKSVRRFAEEALSKIEERSGTPKEEIDKTLFQAEEILRVERDQAKGGHTSDSPKEKRYLSLFEHELCSRCGLFYTSPNKCPFDRDLRENCRLFVKIDDDDRGRFVEDPFWRFLILEVMRGKYSRGYTITCRHCGAQNSDPDITGRRSCSRCGKRLE
jgi:hypothetical protein